MERALRRATGAHWLLGFRGVRPPEDFLRLLEAWRPPAVILFRDNLPAGGDALPALRRRLEEAAGRELAVFLDEEGGWIQQLGGDWPAPRAQALAGVGAVTACHRAMAARAASLGADALCAPVADLDDGAENPVIGSRSFGGDPDAAADMVAAALRGLAAAGVLGVIKHFPGHGDAREDSHEVLPAVAADRAAALVPFRRGVEAGAPAVMTAHVRLAGDDDPRPATFREDLLRELLPGETGFAGLVISDALEMGAAAAVPAAERAAAAFAAGCHLLTLARWEPGAEALLEGMASALEAGRVRQPWRDEARERWAAFLAARPSPAGGGPEPDVAAVRRAAVFRPAAGDDRDGVAGGRDAGEPDPAGGALWDGEILDLELGATGSWRHEEYLAALSHLSLRRLATEEPLRAGAYLHVGRRPPAAGRLAELAARAESGGEPAVLAAGAWGWTLAFPRRLATADPTPAGLAALLAAARSDAG
ncbi:MAG: glycoside hydrolase family 3 protein [Candidatus Krumholzibacteriota bacterium]|nr:glycoside hydrolase family 3 protein [Candidatus Krumholzibacteriota bacterium]